jgi:peroxiredoxin
MKKFIAALAALMVFGFVSAALAADAAPAAAEKPDWGKNVGDKVKPMEFPIAADGEGVVKTRELKADTMFVFVTAACTQCRKEMLDLGEAKARGELEKASIIIVSCDMNPEGALPRISAMGKKAFPIISDPEYTLGDAVELGTTPSTLIVSKDGVIKFKTAGYKKGEFKKYLETK